MRTVLYTTRLVDRVRARTCRGLMRIRNAFGRPQAIGSRGAACQIIRSVAGRAEVMGQGCEFIAKLAPLSVAQLMKMLDVTGPDKV